MFVRISRNGGEHGPGGYWTIDATRGSGDTRDRVRGGGSSRKLSKSSSSSSSYDSFESDSSSSQFSSRGSSEASVELYYPYSYNQSLSPSMHGYPTKMAVYSPTQHSGNFSPPPAGYSSYGTPGRMSDLSHEGHPHLKCYGHTPY